MSIPKHDDAVETSGTYLQGEIDASYAELVELFGAPNQGDEYKIDAYWALAFPVTRRGANSTPRGSEVIATIYNYKDGVNYLGAEGTPVEEIREWHIGGFSPLSFALVRAALETYRAELVVVAEPTPDFDGAPGTVEL